MRLKKTTFSQDEDRSLNSRFVVEKSKIDRLSDENVNKKTCRFNWIKTLKYFSRSIQQTSFNYYFYYTTNFDELTIKTLFCLR